MLQVFTIINLDAKIDKVFNDFDKISVALDLDSELLSSTDEISQVFAHLNHQVSASHQP